MVGEARDASGDEGPPSGVAALDASQVLVGPSCTVQFGDLGADVWKALFADPQADARGTHRRVSHPTAGDVEPPGSPTHFSRTPTAIRHHPPLLGEPTEEILRAAGDDADGIERLRDDGAL